MLDCSTLKRKSHTVILFALLQTITSSAFAHHSVMEASVQSSLFHEVSVCLLHDLAKCPLSMLQQGSINQVAFGIKC